MDEISISIPPEREGMTSLPRTLFPNLDETVSKTSTSHSDIVLFQGKGVRAQTLVEYHVFFV